MKKILPFIFLTSLLLSACSFEHKEKISESNFELQEKCAKHANDFFEYFINTEDKEDSSFSNHYNPKLGKCFILIDKRKFPIGITSQELFDAVEKKSYGTYISSPNDKGIWNIIECTVSQDGKEENRKECKSEEEFKILSNEFME